ncbi:MAG: UDP-N-acetylglucosamine 2-epimerase [Bradymonadaceae bacterium]
MSQTTVGIVTTSRADWGHLRPVVREVSRSDRLTLRIYASGMHLSPEYGETVTMIERDGFEVDTRIEMLLSSDTPEGVAKSVGLGTSGFAQEFGRDAPDLLMVLGDRYEILAAVTAALAARIPVAHIHGGELSQGAIDDSVRHAVTKMSHLHFVSTDEYRRRVCQLGELPERVHVSGAPGLDNVEDVEVMSFERLEETIGEPLGEGFLLVTYHPVTRTPELTMGEVEALLEVLADTDRTKLFTQPNADSGGREVLEAVRAFVGSRDDAMMVDNLGTRAYFSAMSHAAAMIGNSSSGIIEAASFGLPVVNIGRRQEGRVRGENVVDVGSEASSIRRGLDEATEPGFRDQLEGSDNPYGDGKSAKRIVDVLEELLGERSGGGSELLDKGFYDIAFEPDGSTEGDTGL